MRIPRAKRPKLTRGIKRILERDPAQRILDQLELVQGKATLKTLLNVLGRSKPRAHGGWIHVSDAHVPCDRLLAGALLGVSPPRRPFPPKTRRIFDNGTFMHLRFQNYFLLLPEPFEVEAPKLLRCWPIIGEADIRVQHPEIGKWVIELKTINTGQYRTLHAPFASHIDQTNGYAGMSGSGWGVQIWYENKNNQELKLFTREFDRTAWGEVWERTSEVAGLVLTGDLPGLCPNCPDPEFCEDKIVVTEKALKELHHARSVSYPRQRL